MGRVIIHDHPLLQHKLTLLRQKETDHTITRILVNEITELMVYESTRDLKVQEVDVETPLAKCSAPLLAQEVVVVPILRAGLGMLHGFLELIPSAKVGFIGLQRDEESLEPVDYYCKVPPLDGARVFVVDPMLATAGSTIAAVTMLKELGARELEYLCIFASPEGVDRLHAEHPDVDIYCATVDERLDEHGYIVPGMGDCGDRLYGTL